MKKSMFLKIILITVLTAGSNKIFSSAESFGKFARTSTNAGLTAGVPALVFLLIPFINNKINYGKFFAKRHGKMRSDPDIWAQILVGFPLGAISLASLGVAAVSKFGEYGIKNQLFSAAQFFGGLSGIFALGSLVAAKKWYNIFNKLKQRKEKDDVTRSKEHTQQLEGKKFWAKASLTISSLTATIFAISALKSK